MSAVQTTAGRAAGTAPTKPRFGKRVKKSFKKFPMAYIGAFMVLLLILAAIFAPLIATHPYAMQYNSGLSSTGLPVGPNQNFVFGTDSLGRDMWSRTVYGARISLIVGVSATVISLAIGVTVGLISGFFGGWVDQVIMRLTDTVLAFPFFLFAMALVAILTPSLQNILIALGITGWGVMARVVRGLVLQLKEAEYVQAERAVGASGFRIMFRVILPNAWGPIIILAMLGVGGMMLTEAGLSYLGIGIQPPTPSWGNMIEDGMQTYQFAPWTLWAPGVALVIAVLGFNLLGEGLRDILDPHNSTH